MKIKVLKPFHEMASTGTLFSSPSISQIYYICDTTSIMTFKGFLFVLFLAPILVGCPKDPPEDSILVFTKTEGYVHESIPAGISALEYLGDRNNFNVISTNNAADFTSENLKKYEVVVFLNTTGDVLNASQQQAFEEFIKAGGGFVGIHAASDTEYDWPWYGRLVGAYFESHPDQQNAIIRIKETNHLATKQLPVTWNHFDEWYNFKLISPSIIVLAGLDENSYKGGTNGDYHPISWYQEFDGGKMFYTGLGHTKKAYSNELFLAHILGGIEYVLNR